MTSSWHSLSKVGEILELPGVMLEEPQVPEDDIRRVGGDGGADRGGGGNGVAVGDVGQ